MAKSALITGITGQDGFFLTDFLRNKGYKIYGFARQANSYELINYTRKFPEVCIVLGNLINSNQVYNAIKMASPDEVYNLAGESFVGGNDTSAETYLNVNSLGIVRILDAVLKLGLERKTKIYQASSSEIFGGNLDFPQNEQSKLNPRTHYGLSKSLAHESCQYFRSTFGLHVSCGIMFNHESELRGKNFVTRKITTNLAKIKTGKIKKFKLGDIYAKRDWGYAKEYVEPMWSMLQLDQASDFVIATGTQHTVFEFLEMALKEIGLSGQIYDYVDVDYGLKRKFDNNNLVGNSEKAKKILGWQAKTTLDQIVRKMVSHDMLIELDTLYE